MNELPVRIVTRNVPDGRESYFVKIIGLKFGFDDKAKAENFADGFAKLCAETTNMTVKITQHKMS